MVANLAFLVPKKCKFGIFLRPHGIFWKKEKCKALFGIF